MAAASYITDNLVQIPGEDLRYTKRHDTYAAKTAYLLGE